MNKVVAQRVGAGAVLLVIVLVVVGAIVLTNPKKSTTADTQATTTTSPASTNTAAAVSYKDGSYTAEGSYSSPGGTQSVKVTLQVQGDTVTDSTVVSEANDPTASSYQSIFISNYKQYVVGKKLNDISVSNVSGSSLTSKGFTNALNDIENQAKA